MKAVQIWRHVFFWEDAYWSLNNFKSLFQRNRIKFSTPLPIYYFTKKHDIIFKQTPFGSVSKENKFLWMKNSVKSLILLSVENPVQKITTKFSRKK